MSKSLSTTIHCHSICHVSANRNTVLWTVEYIEYTKVLCPLFDKIETLILSHSASIFRSLDKMWNLN